MIATVYDVIPYVMKENYLHDDHTHEWYMGVLTMLKSFDKCLVISESVKTDLVNLLGFEEDRIHVMHGAANEIFKKTEITDRQEFLAKFAIKDKFIMSTAGDDSRKNVLGLIYAYSRLPARLIEEYQLAVVCGLKSEACNMYSQAVKRCGLSGRVVFTGFVSDEELLKLYNLTQLMAFPSKYEGFGLPVAEAFACGAPVLTSNNSSLGEIAEGAAVLVDPCNTDDIKNGMEHALTSVSAENIKSGYEKLNHYKWQNVAAIALNVINSLKPEKKYYEYDINQPLSNVTAETLENIITYELLQKNYTPQETLALSRTLAY
jgi:glycosyltransferase involved in cell wall biosynthesis